MNRARHGLHVFTLTLTVLFLASSTAAQTLHMPPHEKYVLKNGLTVLLLEKHGVPMINLYAIVKTGSAADPASEDGLASVTAGLLRKGAKARTAQQFAADLDYIGGAFEAEAGADFSSVSAEFLTKDLARGLELFSDALLHPTFPKDETDKLLAQSLDEIKTAKNSPGSVIFEYYKGYLLPNHPYGRPEGGTEISLKKIQRESVLKFYETHYAPGNMILAVAGDFNAGEMRKKIEQDLAVWSARQVSPSTIPAPEPAKGRRLLLVNKVD